MTDFILRHVVRDVLAETTEADPGKLAGLVLARIPKKDYPAALSQALRLFVRQIISETRTGHNAPAPTQIQGSRKVAAIRPVVDFKANTGVRLVMANLLQALSAEGIVSRAQLEAARTRVSTGQSALAQARAQAARVQAELGGSGGVAASGGVAVRAPAGGQVLSVANESEGVIAEGTPLVTIGDPARIEVVVDLLSREAVRVKPGDAVEITAEVKDEALQPFLAEQFEVTIEREGRTEVRVFDLSTLQLRGTLRLEPQ